MDTLAAAGQLPADPPRPRSARRAPGTELTAGLATLVTLGVLGAAVALVWAALSPRVRIVITPAGPDLVQYANSDFFAGDGTFLVVGLVAGVLSGIVCWFIAQRWRGPVILAGLALGALLGALVAWQVGRQLGLTHYHQLLHSTEVGRRFDKPVDLRSKAALLAQPFAATLTYVFLAARVARPDLDRSPRRDSVEPERDPKLGEWDRNRA
ncbi:MAG: DUF2567 domain-containing protein [Actinomycetota bacterium]|nr:DUF2567 domain-containing protein [Actinomycetota bacterium]